MHHCPDCGATIDYNISTSTEKVGTCQRCTVTLSASEWQRYATDSAFRASYANAVNSAYKLAAQPLVSTGKFATLKMVKNGKISYAKIEYEYEQEITFEVKQATRNGYTVEVTSMG